MERYVTLFDSTFLPQGLALHASLKRHADPFVLWALCMDDYAKSVIDRLNDPTIRTIHLTEIETHKLLAIKPHRDIAEYCWTLTPFTPRIVFDRDPDAQRVTYVDADMFFLKSPAPIFEEFDRSGKAVLITDHAYDAEYDQSLWSGQYCVQLMIFVRDRSEPVRQWWEERCIEWCFRRAEDGKYGDQKYLDDWPVRFREVVHVLSQLDVLLAPWNARRFPYCKAIAWHFHGLRLMGKNKVLLHGSYSVPAVVHKAVYGPYLRELGNSLNILGMESVTQLTIPRYLDSLCKSLILSVLGLTRKIYDYYPIRRIPE